MAIRINDKREINRVLGHLSKIVPQAEHRLVRVGSAKWTNEITKKMETVRNIWFLGWMSGARPLIIDYFEIYDCDSGTTTRYWITDRFTHVNLANHQDSRSITLESDGKFLPETFNLYIYGQEFCNPITALHIYECGDEKDMANLLRVTLLSQNLDDAYGEVTSVSNSYIDYPVQCSRSYRWMMKHNSSPLELICNMSADSIRKMGEFEINDLLRDITSIEKNEVYAKARTDKSYYKVKKSELREHPDNYSKYYPVFDYNAVMDMEIKIPKNRFDLGVYGLGSAGTAILDQLCRSNWVKSIYLCDYDTVEAKNQINQWYNHCDVGSSKVSASVSIIENMERSMSDGISTNFITRYDYDKFQNTKLEENSFTYVVSGFDSINARKEFLDYILDGKIEAKYLIDCRYLDLACSIYFIDLNNVEEVEFYKANLEADAELIQARVLKEKLTREEFVDWYDRKGYFQRKCRTCRTEYLKDTSYGCVYKAENYCGQCKDEGCINYLYGLYEKSLPNDKVSIHDASCVKYNYIDIYKYVGAIIFGAIRSIENGKNKPFSLIEAQTDVKGLPNYMVVKE